MKNLVILGAGTGGTIMANKLVGPLRQRGWKITVIDKDDNHYYQPGFLLVPFGVYHSEDLVRKRSQLLPKGVDFLVKEVEEIKPQAKAIKFADGQELAYDLLLVATGAHLCPEETPGMLDGWRQNIFDYYSIDGATALAEKLKEFREGRLVVHINEMPIKCNVSPLEFAFLADWYFRKRQVRDNIEIVYLTPISGAFTRPVATRYLGDLQAEKKIEVESFFMTEKIDPRAGKVICYDGREVSFDLLVTIPTNMGAELIKRSGLGDEMNYVVVDKSGFRSEKYADIFVMGDAAGNNWTKAGSVVHFESEILDKIILAEVDGQKAEVEFDGHANCFIETGFGKGVVIDYNEQVEPLPGKFPLPGLGPMSLLKETRLNHWSKLAFEWVYWHWLLKGRAIPLVPALMSMRGKKDVRQA
ncbi:MAG: NAD(P)/FAD-dependent oxidoreductase [Candidatus Aminicenantes bacterium]|nr:NAD(P)/FAD-dependent oxidoreductase [Candidatus Aminicenantes bacterium]